MAQARLLALCGPIEGSEVPLLEQEFTIGRDESNSLCLSELTVSRKHCVIRRDGIGFRLSDLGSANRTAVNGQPTQETLLAHGDEILVGTSRLVFLVGEREPSTPASEIISATPTAIIRREQALYLRPDQVLETSDASQHAPRHLRTLLRVASAISAASDLQELQKELIGALAESIAAERGAVILEDGATAFYWNRDEEPDSTFRPPASVVARVRDEGVAVCLNNILLGDPRSASFSVKSARINSLLAAPVGTAQRILGVIYLDARSPSIRFGEDDLQLVAGIACMAMAPLANALRVRQLEVENQRLEQDLRGEGGMVGNSPRMRVVYTFIRRVAPTPATVLICGESGSGKELVARAVHHNSPRSARPFVAINCAAITDTLLESEFFGHEKGAFTGAAAQKRGKLEEAEGGTVFLDEIGELAPLLQAKLLRVLQEREFERVGGTRTIHIDVRVVAATNRDLTEMVRKGTFRQDLYYRLNVVSLTLPALRERRADILGLANYFLEKRRDSAERLITGFSTEARTCLTNYDWPGNVRELQNAIEHAVVLGTTEEILPEDLPDPVVQTGDSGEEGGTAYGTGGKFHETIRQMKRQLVIKAMEQAKQNYTEAAKLLGLHPNNLHRLMKSLQLK